MSNGALKFSELTGAPLLLQAGARDDYDEPDSCARLVESLPQASRDRVELRVYPEATQAWDRLEPAMTVEDPMSHAGRGGTVAIEPSPEVAEQSRQAVLEFFQRHLGVGP